MGRTTISAIHRSRVMWTLWLFWLVVFAAGCSTVYDIKQKTVRASERVSRKIASIGDIGRMKITDDGMKKKVAIDDVTDETGFQAMDTGKMLQKRLAAYLTDSCAAASFTVKGEPGYPAQLERFLSDRSGRIDNFRLMEIGRAAGLNAVVTGSVVDIGEYTEKQGLWWFRDTHKFLQVLVNVEAYDMETAAKLVDESYHYETELDIVEFDDFSEDPQDLVPVITRAIDEAAEFLAYQVCDALNRQAWTGYVVSAGEHRVEISSGSRAGLSEGQVLAVYRAGETMQGMAGQRFVKPGEKIGEIKITAIYPDSALGEIVSGKVSGAGDTVRPE